MKKSRIALIAVLALALSLAVTFIAYNALLAGTAPVAEQVVPVVVAAAPINIGTRLESDQLRIRQWPKSEQIEGSFRTPEEVVGRGTLWPLAENEPVLESKLAAVGAGSGLTAVIPEGMRALAVKVNDVIGVAGFAIPGTRVDVILVGSAGTQRDSDTSRVILENVEVLAAGQNIERDAKGKPLDFQVVTLLVSPADAQKLALASVDGRIQLALRNPMDIKQVSPGPTKRDTLYSGPTSAATPLRAPRQAVTRRPVVKQVKVEATPPPPPEKKTYKVELLQGTDRQTIQFDEKDSSKRQ